MLGLSRPAPEAINPSATKNVDSVSVASTKCPIVIKTPPTMTVLL